MFLIDFTVCCSSIFCIPCSCNHKRFDVVNNDLRFLGYMSNKTFRIFTDESHHLSSTSTRSRAPIKASMSALWLVHASCHKNGRSVDQSCFTEDNVQSPGFWCIVSKCVVMMMMNPYDLHRLTQLKRKDLRLSLDLLRNGHCFKLSVMLFTVL